MKIYKSKGGLLNRNDAKVNHTQLTVDQLNYTYFDNSNRIQKIEDVSQFNTSTDVKHFYDITNTATTDFTYDNNANITQDNNKNITTTLNFLNLPQTVSKDVNNVSKTIDYLYDATGNKLQTIEGTTTTDYINGIQYTNGNLAAIATAEGRVRPKSYFANNTTAFVYDYYIKDHLGNVRVTITEEDNRDYYMATMEEQNDATESVLFDNVPQTRYDIPYTYPPDSTYTPNASISRLNGQDSTTIGHAKILQVREGDNLTFDTKYFYHDSTVAYNPSPVSTIITQLTGIILGNSLAGNGLTADEANAWITEAFTNGPVNNFLTSTFNQNNTGSPELPQAYLVYLTFDESFNLIESKSGMLQATEPDELGELAVANLQIEKNGFIYIYVNNQSGYPVNFDNLRIAHKLASVMEVNNYYPYGLLNSSLSYSRSGNRYKYQTKEVDNYMDYNILDFGARHYDAATARWTAYDPASQFATPYISMGGNPVSGIDPTGTVSHRLSDAQAASQQDRETMEAMDNRGGGGALPWYAMSSRDVAAMQLQYGTTYGQQEKARVETLMSIGGYTAHDGTVYSYNSAGVAVKTVDMITQPTMNGQPVSSIGQKIGEATVPLDYFTNANAQISSMNFSGYDFQLTFDFPIRNGSAQGGGGGSDKDIYLGIAGGVVSGMELSYLNDAKQVLKYGQRIDGKVRSAETLTRANRISSTATAKYLGYAGKALGIYGAYDAGTKLLNDPSNPANWVKFGASTGMLFMKANPFTFVVGVGYTVLDQGGYIDEWIGNKP